MIFILTQLHVTLPLHCRLNREEAAKFSQFETKFKKFLYCGVSVHHLMPNCNTTRSGLTKREKRTLWLMLPEVGSLRLGFVSKAQDNGSDVSMDDSTATSSLASSRADVNVRFVHHDLRKFSPEPVLLMLVSSPSLHRLPVPRDQMSNYPENIPCRLQISPHCLKTQM